MNTPKPSRRRRGRSATEWKAIVDDLRASGASATAYAAQHNLSASSLLKWRSRLARGQSRQNATVRRPRIREQPALVPVQVLGHRIASDGTPCGSHIEVVAPGGYSVRVFGDVDGERLAAVLRATQECAC